MFEELSDSEIIEWKRQITAFIRSGGMYQSLSLDGMSITVSQDNAVKILNELSKEQKRRRSGNNPFISVGIR